MTLRRILPLFVGCLASTLVAAQTKRAMTIVDLIEVPQLRSPQLSPDGSQLLYALSEADWKANKRVSHIWRVEVASGEVVQLTNGEKGESSRAGLPTAIRSRSSPSGATTKRRRFIF